MTCILNVNTETCRDSCSTAMWTTSTQEVVTPITLFFFSWASPLCNIFTEPVCRMVGTSIYLDEHFNTDFTDRGRKIFILVIVCCRSGHSHTVRVARWWTRANIRAFHELQSKFICEPAGAFVGYCMWVATVEVVSRFRSRSLPLNPMVDRRLTTIDSVSTL